MAAILQTRGPVVEHKVVVWNFKFLKMMTAKQFVAAATELHEANLGQMMSVKCGGRPYMVFIKRPPEEIQDALLMNQDLCQVDYYATRYRLPVSKSVSFALRASLVQSGVVPAKLLK